MRNENVAVVPMRIGAMGLTVPHHLPAENEALTEGPTNCSYKSRMCAVRVFFFAVTV